MDGLNNLLIRKSITNEIITRISTDLFTIDIQQFNQSIRYKFFKLLEILLLKSNKTFGDNFIKHAIISIEGEKDPRNLLVTFNLINQIVINEDITMFVEVFKLIIGIV